MNTPICIGLALIAVAVLGCASAVSERPATGSLRHVVLLKFKDDAKPEQIQAVVEKFRGLKKSIPEIQDLEWGTNVSPENKNEGFTHCFFLTFADAKGRDAYLPHPAHKEFGGVLRPVLDKVLVVDYVSKD